MTVVGASAVAGAGALALAMSSLAANADEPGTVDDGDVGTKIINGEPAEEGQYPWMVALAEADDPTFNFCGGSMLTEDVVLTAAHCLEASEASEIVVRHGSVDLESDDMVDVPAEELHIPDNYGEPTELANDWGLIKLAEPIADTETLSIAETEEHDEGDFEVMGWGLDENDEIPTELHWAEVPFVDDEQCAEAYDDSGMWDADSMICAGFWDEGGVDACSGDSGGPLISFDEAGDPIQVGIVSWGNECALPENPGVYAQVSYAAEEILEAADALS